MTEEIKEIIEVKEQAKEILKDIAVNENNELVGKSLSEKYRIAQYYASSGLLPQAFNTPEKALVAAEYCNSLGLNLATSIRQICVINGKPSIYGDLPLAIVRKSGLMDYIHEIIIDKEGNEICFANKNIDADIYGAVCTVSRKGEDDDIERFFTLKDAERAGLLRSQCWQKYPKDMLKYRARTQALKDVFSDALNGVAIAEYDHAVMPQNGIIKTKKIDNEVTDYFTDGENNE